MYPRNAASPPRISIGAVVQISDGAVQTSGVAVKVIPQGGSEASGSGTVAYSADGVVVYTPTQAETNYTAMVFVASKTGCIPATVTVVTSASETAGYAGLDWAKVGNPTTVVGLSSTTISTSQAVASVTARVTANADQWGGASVTGMPMPTYTQPTGFLAATFPATVSSYAGGAVASVTGAVASVTSAVTVGTNNDKTGYTLTVTPPTAAAIADAVWDESMSTHTINGSYGSHVVRSANQNQNTVAITGNQHVAADIHELQTAVITADKFAANWLTAAGTAADYITKMQTAIGTATDQAAIKTVTDRLNTGLVADGAVYQFTANMLELAPAGGGGGTGDASQTTLLQVQSTVNGIASSLSGVPITATGRIADGGTISLYCGDDLRVRSGTQLTLTVTDVGGSIYSRLNAIGTGNLAFGASRRGLPVSAISGSLASLTSVGSGASQTVQLVVEIDNAGGSLQPAEDYEWQIESEQTQGSEIDQLVEMAGILVLRRRTV
jgi:hypothetical protein